MRRILYPYLLVWLVYINVGSSLATLNITDSSSNDNRITGDGRPSNENEDTKLNVMNLGAADEMEDLRLRRALQLKEIPTAWGTRGMFSRRRNRDIMKRYKRHSMSPRSFPRERRFGYRGRYPGRFARYAPSYEYSMGNYGPYPQRFAENSMYNQQPFTQRFPNTYQQTEFTPQSRVPYYGTQTYVQPQQPSPAPAQSYYPDQYNMQSQRQPPQPYFQQSNVPSMYYTNRPASNWDNQEQPVRAEIQRNGGSAQFRTPIQPASESQSRMMATLPNQENATGLLKLSRTAPSQSLPDQRTEATPMPQENRNEPARLGVPRPAFGMAGSGDPREAAQSQRIAAATTDETRNRPIGSELQREGSFSEFGTSTRPTGQRGGDRFAEPQENRRTGDQAVESGSNGWLSTPSAQPTQTSDGTVSAPQENPGQQLDAQRPLSGLFSFLRSPSATTATESNNLQSRSVVEPSPPQTPEQPTLAQVAPQVTAAA